MTQGRLSARKVATAAPGEYGDGGGLYLLVSKTGARSWIFRYRLRGKRREMGMGRDISLAEARDRRDEAKRLLRSGADPIDERRRQTQAEAGRLTFGKVADDLFDAKQASWRHPNHRHQWRMAITVGMAPLRDKPVNEVDTAAVLRTLEPVWTKTPETAARLRARIEAVLDAATARGLRTGANPAAWKGRLAHMLPPARTPLNRGHYAALPYGRLPELVAALRAKGTPTARCLELIVLTAVRKSEALGATFAEFDLNGKVWTLPAGRMKGAREHRVPLAARAIEIIRESKARAVSGYCFPGRTPGAHLTGDPVQSELKRLGFGETTVHGLRASFRTWVAEETQFPRELAEEALAHVVGDATERAYRRGDLLEKRRALMDAWADFCEGCESKPGE